MTIFITFLLTDLSFHAVRVYNDRWTIGHILSDQYSSLKICEQDWSSNLQGVIHEQKVLYEISKLLSLCSDF
ncbi:hypothetical protein BpHYR1_023410 [Brachionus plicatilis]|uniref:Uncharacterized protein n=1 Tax=Brachionus plicatilis TaxID=10195 RepID=A0A3M7QZB4_BRAPC|nr:hypothetical protein BpHYR1_023410 [Brachionus plicatilis]